RFALQTSLRSSATLSPDARMNDLGLLRYAVRNYRSLQGLRWLPFGVAIILNQWLQDPRGGWDVGLVLGLLAAGIAGAVLIGHWYRDRYGFQRPLPPSSKAIPIAIALLVLFYAVSWLEA